MSIATRTLYTGDWTVNNAVISQHGTYSYTVTATVDGMVDIHDF
jgi:hypothetical protein